MRRRRCSRKKHVWPAGRALTVRSEDALSNSSMALSLRILLVGIRDVDLAVRKKLPVHRLDRSVGRLEAIVADEPEAAAVARLWIAHDLWRLAHHAKCAERIVENLLVNLFIEVADEQVGSYILALPILRRLVHSNRLSEQLHHVHDLDRIVRVLLRAKLHEAKALRLVRNPVAGHMDMDHGASLQHQLPQQLLCHSIVQVAAVRGRILVAVFLPAPTGARRHAATP